MFSKISRYRKLPDDVTLDVKGRRLRSKSLRLTPPAAAGFSHALEEGERLDHLAFKYYEQSRDWWRICDANREVLSPWELVGAEPWTTVRIEITRSGKNPPWPALLARLRLAPGVDRAWLGSAETPFPELVTASCRWSLTVVFNRLTTTVERLVELVEAEGFAAATPEEIGYVGKPVAIPPRVD